MAKNASHFVPTLRAGTEKIPADLLDLDGFEAGEVDAADVTVAADAENGLSAGTLQAALESLAARVQALEDAAAQA